MRGLVIDTTLGACTVAVFDDSRVIVALSEPMAKGHQERLGGMVRDVVGDDFDRLDRIGVAVGPGSFTGLRVGLAFAQGLGLALDRPVVGISTLAALARSVPELDQVAAVIDARRGQVYVQVFVAGSAVGAPRALPLEDAVDLIGDASGPDLILVGSGAALVGDRFTSAVIAPLAAATPEALAALTREANPVPGETLSPLYLRAPDATPPRRLPGAPRA